MFAFLEGKHNEEVVFPWSLFTKVKFYSDFGFLISFFFFFYKTAFLAVKTSLYMLNLLLYGSSLCYY